MNPIKWLQGWLRMKTYREKRALCWGWLAGGCTAIVTTALGVPPLLGIFCTFVIAFAVSYLTYSNDFIN